MYAIIAILIAVFSLSAIAVEDTTQRTITGTYTIPQLDAGVTAVNTYIMVSVWDRPSMSFLPPLNYVMPAGSSYSIQVPWSQEYQMQGQYDVNDGRLSPISPVFYGG